MNKYANGCIAHQHIITRKQKQYVIILLAVVYVSKKYGAIGTVSSARPGVELRLCPWLMLNRWV